MTLPYNSFQSLSERYYGTVIYNGDDPIYVTGLDGGQVPAISYRTVGAVEKHFPHSIAANNPALRDGPFSLGYVNKVPFENDDGETKFMADYMIRIPKRQWKQGICGNNVELKATHLDFSLLVVHPQFREMLMNKYPSKAKALTLLREPYQSVAFNLRLALFSTDMDSIGLEYRGRTVGVSEDGDKFKLKKDSFYLQEFLEANGVELW